MLELMAYLTPTCYVWLAVGARVWVNGQHCTWLQVKMLWDKTNQTLSFHCTLTLWAIKNVPFCFWL